MASSSDQACLTLRLAGPLQSWGSTSQFNRRETNPFPTKSGIVGLLAAADGRRRNDPILDLVQLRLGVRVDQPGRLLRDYHTVSNYKGLPLLRASVDGHGRQLKTSPPKYTSVTERFYLQDAVFVAVLEGNRHLLSGLAEAVMRPAFPLALGRRSCVPSQPLLLRSDTDEVLWPPTLENTLETAPWQASEAERRRMTNAEITVSVIYDSHIGDDVLSDVPITFEPSGREYSSRRVRQTTVILSTGISSDAEITNRTSHDPFELLGW